MCKKNSVLYENGVYLWVHFYYYLISNMEPTLLNVRCDCDNNL